MSDLSKSKLIEESHSDSRTLTYLIKELNNAIRGLQSVDDYLTRLTRAKEILGKESIDLGENVDQKKNDLHDSLLEIGKFVQSALDNIPIEDEELDAATEQLIKFMGTKEEAIEYAQKELKGQEDGSYWFKYWSGLIDRLNNAKD
ncbi:MAG: hypothetical protein VX984_02020 [Thermodesulfobacteriota bacterium]|nr:hypothetical protein [Thermodesulfobacteriota bacterium]MEE2975426.1 hypothetical protein [Thermodesulfobacteriota bacterium]|tara:strand:- start:9138 stop:9572 length:435 start_codon:yes stop_codon:yes gene_type:complete